MCVCECVHACVLAILPQVLYGAYAAQWSQDCIFGGLDGVCFTVSDIVW